jgi:uncharacterized protein
MTLSPAMTLGSFLVAVMVGLTGMGGGALLTPMLMLVFGVPPLAAVSSDLVVSAITKPVGALVHLRRRTVNLRLASWLSIGSVPSAFAGGLIGWWLGPGSTVQTVTSHTTGVVLVVAASGIAYRTIQVLISGAAKSAGAAQSAGAGREIQGQAVAPLVVRKVPTVLIGIVVGLAVGITSTGSGTLVIAALTALYPALPPNRLVGTDLAQAVPMVLSAALAHVIAGNVVMSVTAPLLVGGIPGVILGSLLASVAPSGALRPVLSLVILASGLSLLGVGPVALVVVLACVLAASALLVTGLRRKRLAAASHAAGGGAEAPDSRLTRAGRATPDGRVSPDDRVSPDGRVSQDGHFAGDGQIMADDQSGGAEQPRGAELDERA